MRDGGKRKREKKKKGKKQCEWERQEKGKVGENKGAAA